MPRRIPLILLLLPRIPSQLSPDTIDPILAAPTVGLDAGERKTAGADGHVVSRVQLDALAAVEAGPAVGPRVVRHADA